ncbi:MAG: hypothetical protein ACI8PQ_001493 [Planctomycetota bacterium]|jgi:hypothetical protein
MIVSTALLLPLLASPVGIDSPSTSMGDPVPVEPGERAPLDWVLMPLVPVADDAGAVDWLDPSRALSRTIDGTKFWLDSFHVDLLLRGVYTSLDSDIEGELANDDLLDFALVDGDVALSAFRGGWSARGSVDLAGIGKDDYGAWLEDLYLRWTDRVHGEFTAGRFKPFVMRSSEADPEHLLFPTRTIIGTAFDLWDEGVEWHGNFDEFDWWLSASNREDDLIEENLYAARGEWAFYDAAWEPMEGSRGAPNHLRMVFGAVLLIDDEDDAGSYGAIGADANFTLGPSSFAVEWMDLERSAVLGHSEEVDFPYNTAPGGKPWSVTWGRTLGDDYQVALRVQDAGDTLDAGDTSGTMSYGLGLNWFPVDAPIGLLGEVTRLDRDEGEDGLILRLGFTFGLSRHDEPVYLR